MDRYGLVDAIEEYCTEQDYKFIYGNEAFANALLDSTVYAPGKIIIVADFTCIPTYTNGKITELSYQGVFMVGQKCEALTTSNLDETPMQKYKLRLKFLSNLLTTILSDLACENELEISNVNIKYDLNKFDLNADFVACTLTFVQ